MALRRVGESYVAASAGMPQLAALGALITRERKKMICAMAKAVMRYGARVRSRDGAGMRRVRLCRRREER